MNISFDNIEQVNFIYWLFNLFLIKERVLIFIIIFFLSKDNYS